jgi:hypothetical protein
MNTHEWAVTWHNLGIATIPVRYKDKRPTVAWEKYKTELPTRNDLMTWFTHGHTNYGVVCGWRELVVLDFDDTQEWSNWQVWLRANKITVVDSAFQVLSSRGVHVYLRQANAGRNKKVGKIDIKTTGYVLGPGSIHPSGAEYRAIRDTMMFPLIQTLSDVLPAHLLTQYTEHAPGVVVPQVQTTPASDPWQVVNTPGVPSRSVVEKIKATYHVEDFFGDKTATGGSRWYLTRCPLHEDSSPSMWIDVAHQLVGCFAGCTPKPLDVINLYARLHGLSNELAIFEMSKSV